MSRYARDHAIAGDDFSDFINFVTALDEEYLEIVQEQVDASREAT